MSPLKIWITIAGMTAITVLTRSGFLLLPERFSLPPIISRALRYAPACALVAIIVPDVMSGQIPGAGFLHNARLLGALAGAATFYRTRSMLATIAVGMLALTLARFALG